jgi:homoserine kinase
VILAHAQVAPIDGELWGDVVEVEAAATSSFEVTGEHAGGLPADPGDNLVVRARALYDGALRARGTRLPELKVTLHKGLPLASGLGSSSASIVAALVAFDAVMDRALGDARLLGLAGEAEALFSGAAHLDNVAPALLGGLRLVPVRGTPRPVPWPEDLMFVVAHPALSLSTAASRAALPAALPLHDAVGFAQNLAAFLSALYTGDRALLRETLRDPLAEPHRAGLVPGFRAAQSRALAAGALGCSLSGSGPSVFAAAPLPDARAVAQALIDGFGEAGVRAQVRVCRPGPGARRL